MNRLPRPVRLALPIAVALVVALATLWTRSAPERQGGYCVNATVVIAGVLTSADDPGSVGSGPLPDAGEILAKVIDIDVRRLQVATPAAVRADVALLATEVPAARAAGRPLDPKAAAAFARVAGDYLTRCRTGTASS